MMKLGCPVIISFGRMAKHILILNNLMTRVMRVDGLSHILSEKMVFSSLEFLETK
jgi:hypothetical protein